jgi:hypothetical protein
VPSGCFDAGRHDTASHVAAPCMPLEHLPATALHATLCRLLQEEQAWLQLQSRYSSAEAPANHAAVAAGEPQVPQAPQACDGGQGASASASVGAAPMGGELQAAAAAAAAGADSVAAAKRAAMQSMALRAEALGVLVGKMEHLAANAEAAASRLQVRAHGDKHHGRPCGGCVGASRFGRAAGMPSTRQGLAANGAGCCGGVRCAYYCAGLCWIMDDAVPHLERCLPALPPRPIPLHTHTHTQHTHPACPLIPIPFHAPNPPPQPPTRTTQPTLQEEFQAAKFRAFPHVNSPARLIKSIVRSAAAAAQ